METNKIFLAVILTTVVAFSESFNFRRETPVGIIMGNKKLLTQLDRHVEVYLGVRYAEAPIKELRFKDPVPPPKDPTIALGSEIFPPSCPQRKFDFLEGFKGVNVFEFTSKVDEDCLFLNIWKPCDGHPKKPVIVWIHGGAYSYGSTSNPLYEGSHLAAWSDSVVVSIQYRLGVFGFLYTGDEFAPGNVGLKDQVLALKWVRNNIEYFGGDKDMITVVGESAGSTSVALHTLNPETSKLFKQSILQSGTSNCFWSTIDSTESKRRSLMLASRLGANISNYEDVKKYLLKGDYDEILKTEFYMIPGSFFGISFWPTIEKPLIPEHPIDMMKKADHLKGRNMIVSWNKQEGGFFASILAHNLNIIQSPSDDLIVDKEFFLSTIVSILGRDETIIDKVSKIYSESGMNYLEQLVNFIGDVAMKCCITDFIEEARRLGSTVYHYEYDHRTRENAWPEWVGCTHTDDLEMFFGLPIYQRNNYNSNSIDLCQNYLNNITSFVSSGNPNKAGKEIWSKDKMLIFSTKHKTIDNGSTTCLKLKELNNVSMVTDVSSRLTIQFELVGVIVAMTYVLIAF